MYQENFFWKPCMKSWNMRRIVLLIISLFILVFAIATSIYLIIVEYTIYPEITVITMILMLALGIGQFLYFYFTFVLEGRKYKLDENGIWILYGKFIKKFYPWVSFQKIVVCDFDHATKNPTNCSIIIRLASFEEPYGPSSPQKKYSLTGSLSGIESWREYHYTIRHFTHILVLEYSPELLDEILQLSNLRVTFSLTRYGKAKLDDMKTRRIRREH